MQYNYIKFVFTKFFVLFCLYRMFRLYKVAQKLTVNIFG